MIFYSFYIFLLSSFFSLSFYISFFNVTFQSSSFSLFFQIISLWYHLVTTWSKILPTSFTTMFFLCSDLTTKNLLLLSPPPFCLSLSLSQLLVSKALLSDCLFLSLLLISLEFEDVFCKINSRYIIHNSWLYMHLYMSLCIYDTELFWLQSRSPKEVALTVPVLAVLARLAQPLFKLFILTWKDWSRDNIQDFHG